jgi:hypothetical protein
MKYWNKQHHVREKNWHVITVNADPRRAYFHFDIKFGIMKHWCQNQTSTGKFFIKPNWKVNTGLIYFERSEDATWFCLNWL